ncbi:unnamed protein product, partial [Cladocopium goreaui]
GISNSKWLLSLMKMRNSDRIISVKYPSALPVTRPGMELSRRREASVQRRAAQALAGETTDAQLQQLMDDAAVAGTTGASALSGPGNIGTLCDLVLVLGFRMLRNLDLALGFRSTPGLLIVTKLMATNLLFGYSCCLIAGIGFAVNYLPVKSCDVGDGIFFSAAMSGGILLVGLVTGMFLTSTPNAEIPAFEPLAAAGGAMWMLGNLMCPYIIQTIGLGLGLTVWDLSNMLMGWVTGYLGLFGLPKEQDVKQPWANFVGLVLASVSLIFFSLASAFDDFEPAREVEIKKVNSECGDLPDIEDGQTTMQKPATLKHGERGDAGSDCANRMKAMLGFSMAILAGVLFGSTFDLPMDLKNGIFGPDHSQHIMDYVLSHFIGIFAAASFALTVYIKVRGKKSQLPRQLIVPSLVSGVIWGIAQVAWFQANIEASSGFSLDAAV